MLTGYELTGHAKSELTPLDSGCWLVTTAGSQHVWDLDARTYQRIPGEGRSAFAHDTRVVVVSHVQQWPAVGCRSFLWFDDPDNEFLEQWRISSTITSIRELRHTSAS